MISNLQAAVKNIETFRIESLASWFLKACLPKMQHMCIWIWTLAEYSADSNLEIKFWGAIFTVLFFDGCVPLFLVAFMVWYI